MTREEAFADLSSKDVDVRLSAARFFALNAIASDRRKLRTALNNEVVPWVRRALERAIQRVGSSNEPTEIEAPVYADPPQRLVADLRASAIEEVAGTIIHELSTIVASLKLAAPRDVPEYAGSRTEHLVNSLASLVSGIRSLKAAASRANYVECNLAQECRDACAIFDDGGDLFRFAGPNPFMVEIDPDLLKLALTNIVRNAVEAVSGLGAGAERTVTLNWGRAGREVWLSVLDTGLGFEKEPTSMLDFGKSTKEEHIGFGLATAKQAMQMMEGDVYPANAAGGGARIELRWFAGHEDSVR